MSTGIDLAGLGSSLVRDTHGVWRPHSERDYLLSFPADGHDRCFGVEDESFWFAHRSRCIIAALAHTPFDGPLLDVGGGNGAVAAALERAEIDTVLLEPSSSGVRNARQRGLRTVACSTIDDAAFRSATFGAAGLFDVIEHLEDDQPVLREVRRVLRPGGVACVTVPAYPALWSDEDELAGHHRRYTLASLERSLRSAGFSLRYGTYLFAALTLPFFALRTLPHRLLRRSRERVANGASRQLAPSPLVRRVLDAVLAPELRAIEAGRRVPIGTSCLAIAVAS
jgi:SAM-dependent methyltransferase